MSERSTATRELGPAPRGGLETLSPEAAGLERIVIERPVPPWPEPMAAAARRGIAGEVLGAFEPITEADPNAILVQFLAAAGNLLGNAPHLVIGEKRHALRIWAIVVGSTASGKKGTAAGVVFSVLDEVDPAWAACRKAGIASGEAIVHHVRDDQERMRRVREADGTVRETGETVAGVSDKRLLLLEEELSRVLRLSRKDGSTLSATLREAWDHDTLMTTAKTAPERATGAHVTVLGHITPEELRRELTSAEISNGFANRFLFASSRRSKHLSFPPRLEPAVRARLVGALRRVADFWRARQGADAEIALSHDAQQRWAALKPALEEEAERAEAAGLAVGKVISRGAPYLLRLAALYATLEESLVIELVHLEAAEAVWRYSVASARAIFGDELAHPDARRVLEAIEAEPLRALARTRVHELLHGHRSAAALTKLRDLLIGAGRIEAYVETGTEGRRVEWWCGR